MRMDLGPSEELAIELETRDVSLLLSIILVFLLSKSITSFVSLSLNQEMVQHDVWGGFGFCIQGGFKNWGLWSICPKAIFFFFAN